MTNDFDYSVRVKTGASWRNFDRVRLMISVGQEYHEGKKLQATVEWINRNPCIERVHISDNDLLQCHNFIAAGMSSEQAEKVALSAGALWLARNEETLLQIRAPIQITRWKDWFNRAQFEVAHRAIKEYATVDSSFNDSVNEDAGTLAARKLQRGEPVPPRLVAHSRDYVLEELAVFALQTAELPATEVYPGSNLKSATYLFGKTSLPEAIQPLARRHFTRIDFSKINVGQTAGATQHVLRQHALG